jgi:hypothetical protein
MHWFASRAVILEPLPADFSRKSEHPYGMGNRSAVVSPHNRFRLPQLCAEYDR